jgi:ABC-type transport system involved in multi-copper enzyme maturation permease subunit
MLPLALVAVVGFGLLGSSLADSTGLSVGGTLLSYLALRYAAAPLIVGAARMAGAVDLFAADVERYLFTTWLAMPMAKLHGAATATANMEIKAGQVRWSLGVCAATAAVCLAVALWRFRRKDVL